MIATPAVAARASFGAKASRTVAYGAAPRMAANAKATLSSLHSVATFGAQMKSFGMKTQQPMQMLARVMAQEGAVEEAKVYVGNLSWGTESEDLNQIFAEFGEVVSADVVFDNTGRSRGFGFVTMATSTEAEAAIEALNETEVDGRTVRVDKVLPPGAERPPRERREPRAGGDRFNNPNRLYVGNLPWKFDDYDLEDAFAEFGEVVDAKVMYDRETGRSRGFGFVTLGSDEGVESSIEALDGADVDGRTIRVNRADRS